jgi:hypothetical protein
MDLFRSMRFFSITKLQESGRCSNIPVVSVNLKSLLWLRDIIMYQSYFSTMELSSCSQLTRPQSLEDVADEKIQEKEAVVFT